MPRQKLRQDTRHCTFAQVNHPKRQKRKNSRKRVHAFKVSINVLAKRLSLALACPDGRNR